MTRFSHVETSDRTCTAALGKGLGGVVRTCRRLAGHRGRCTDVPFLDDLFASSPKVANKIVRDSFNTRGASWGKNRGGEQARRNRQLRWTLGPGDSFYPAHYQTYENCVVIAAELALQAYQMVGAPRCRPETAKFLPQTPHRNSAVCAICRNPPEFIEFSLAAQSKAAVDTDHLNPTLKFRHTPGNVAFVHHICNTTTGDRSMEMFLDWSKGVLERHGYSVVKKHQD